MQTLSSIHWFCIMVWLGSLSSLQFVEADYTGHLLQALSFTECRRDCITRCERYASSVPGNLELCVGCLKECISVFAQQANAVRAEIASIDFGNVLAYERNELPTYGVRAPRAAHPTPTVRSTLPTTTTKSTTSTSTSTSANGADRRTTSADWTNRAQRSAAQARPETPKGSRKKTSKPGRQQKKNQRPDHIMKHTKTNG